MSPEQCRDESVGSYTDIYTLGITFYFALTLKFPFTGRTFLDLIEQHLHKEPPPLRDKNPDLPEGIEFIIRKMLAKEVQDRYPSMEVFIQEVDQLPKRFLETFSRGLPCESRRAEAHGTQTHNKQCRS